MKENRSSTIFKLASSQLLLDLFLYSRLNRFFDNISEGLLYTVKGKGGLRPITPSNKAYTTVAHSAEIHANLFTTFLPKDSDDAGIPFFIINPVGFGDVLKLTADTCVGE